ncbi:MAG TPA: hypothetical protein VGE16_14115 [Albitalea sp.]
MSPLALLPLATPVVAAWARWQNRRILRDGEPLTPEQMQIASVVGVVHPERVRVLRVGRIPFPGGRPIDRLARRMGLPGLDVDGLTLGHGIFMRRGAATLRLLAHECRHVAQFEAAGSLRAFLADYLRQVSRHGYADAPYEVDARRAAAHWAHARANAGSLMSPAPD